MTRTCTKCHEAKPATREFFYGDRGGLASQCKLCRIQLSKAYAKAHPEQINAHSRRQRATLKAQAYAAYGPGCACCGETHSAYLELDHIAGDGNLARRKYTSSEMELLDLRRNGWPAVLQVLCGNCHNAKTKGQACAH